MRFLEKQSVVGGSFLKYVEQYKEKNCDSKSPILSVSLEYEIMSVDKDVYSAILRNGSFSFANSTPPYCHSLKALSVYPITYYLLFSILLIVSLFVTIFQLLLHLVFIHLYIVLINLSIYHMVHILTILLL